MENIYIKMWICLLQLKIVSLNSINVMVIADADSLFTVIIVGDFARNSEGAVFKNSKIRKLLEKYKLNIPSSQQLPRSLENPVNVISKCQ